MMSDRHFQGNGIRLRAPEPEDLEVMFRFENATDVWEMSNTTGVFAFSVEAVHRADPE